ncbi:DUF397 domain-containing protein [Streptomyces longwoodensis]|uniref:DUF397 domain-containing protein n=1 Tax=Streptomyces longwoodensis TaxID=68231 RepID=A0A101QQU7_9ACTN|nr:DUF397 domain-containing protein [Streptomyces longwoodensis]KUN34146.1 hypothetical protein AQJ30_31255 [Streptomyces longwoodensis]
MSTEALQWSKSSYSGSEGGACLEVAVTPHTIHVRDSKTAPDHHAPTLHITPATWTDFLAYAVK